MEQLLRVISIEEQLDTLVDYWNPLIVGELNDQVVKVVKLKGEFVMHHHENEDEMFMVVQGNLTIEFEDCGKKINKGEFIIIPKGIKHKPVAENEVHVLLFEPQSTLNTGNITNEMTVAKPKRQDDC